jgi:simple sugar transport system permease protein
MLKRHLMTAHNMTPDAYRTRWSLPKDYPMVALHGHLGSNLIGPLFPEEQHVSQASPTVSGIITRRSTGGEAHRRAIDFPDATGLHDVPVIGPLYDQLISGHNLIVYAAILAVPLTHWVVNNTRFGLRLRAVGENPQAMDTVGISVAWLRYRAVLIGGLLTGTAGTYLAIAQNAGFSRDMTAGQGYIALAAVIFGKRRPYPALGSCLMFGLLDAIAIRLQGVRVAGIGEVPVQLIQALPYLLTVILLAGFIGKAVAPKAVGIPYIKER